MPLSGRRPRFAGRMLFDRCPPMMEEIHGQNHPSKDKITQGRRQPDAGISMADGLSVRDLGIINVLALTGAFYMLQIYDRALGSGSVPTLLAISVLAIGLYFSQGLFDIIRSQILVRVGARLDRKLAPLAHQVTIDMPRFGFSTAEALERGRDVDTVRGFLGSQGPVALFDLPWVPLFIAFVYMLHPWLGMLALGGAVVLSLLTIVTELMMRHLNDEAQRAATTRNTIADFKRPQCRNPEGDGVRRARGRTLFPRE